MFAWPSETGCPGLVTSKKKEHEKKMGITRPRPDSGVIVGRRSDLKAWVKTDVIQFFLVMYHR